MKTTLFNGIRAFFRTKLLFDLIFWKVNDLRYALRNHCDYWNLKYYYLNIIQSTDKCFEILQIFIKNNFALDVEFEKKCRWIPLCFPHIFFTPKLSHSRHCAFILLLRFKFPPTAAAAAAWCHSVTICVKEVCWWMNSIQTLYRSVHMFISSSRWVWKIERFPREPKAGWWWNSNGKVKCFANVVLGNYFPISSTRTHRCSHSIVHPFFLLILFRGSVNLMCRQWQSSARNGKRVGVLLHEWRIV